MSWLLRFLGPRVLLSFGDTLVLDRWRWLRKRLPQTPVDLADVGCGNGWLAINTAQQGHRTTGIGWDDGDLAQAKRRATDLHAENCHFMVQDLRGLSERGDLAGRFDVVTCFETIEHILDDEALMRSLAMLLRPGGRLFLTTPNIDYRPMDHGDSGPFEPIENGGHVRKGYSEADLRRLCEVAGLEVVEISHCSGYLSQRLTKLIRWIAKRTSYGVAWTLTFPLRFLPPPFDPAIRRVKYWPDYSICLVADKH